MSIKASQVRRVGRTGQVGRVGRISRPGRVGRQEIDQGLESSDSTLSAALGNTRSALLADTTNGEGLTPSPERGPETNARSFNSLVDMAAEYFFSVAYDSRS